VNLLLYFVSADCRYITCDSELAFRTSRATSSFEWTGDVSSSRASLHNVGPLKQNVCGQMLWTKAYWHDRQNKKKICSCQGKTFVQFEKKSIPSFFC
jgi:hypothetical protein